MIPFQASSNFQQLRDQIQKQLAANSFGLLPTVATNSNLITQNNLPPYYAQYYSTASEQRLFVNINNSITSIKFGESGSLVEGAWTAYHNTSTIVGWSAFTTKLIYYKVIGNLVFVSFNITGTSNATSVSFTLPYASASGVLFNTCIRTYDNGSYTTTGGLLDLAADGSSTVVCYLDMTGSAASWTGSGNKAVSGQFWYIKA